jgi:hypothetical protein
MARDIRCPDGCGERVLYAVTEAGRRQMLNFWPDPAGLVAAAQDVHGTWHARHAPLGEPVLAPAKRHLPHAATCTARKPEDAQEPPEGVTFLDQWKQASAEHGKLRRRRGGTPAPKARGYRRRSR